MGQIMGTFNTRHLDLNMDDKPSFKTNDGFNFKRKERQTHIPVEHLISAKIPPEFRDYCAHILMDYLVCRHKHMPLVYRCHHEKHAYLNCEHADYILRMKEFERERRLREREIRIKMGKECPAPKNPVPCKPEPKADKKPDCPK